MTRVGFFQMLGDSHMSLGEMNALNNAGDAADAALDQGVMLGQTIATLQGVVAAQRRELATLRSLIGVLAGVLRDTGVVDGAVLDYRLEAALEESNAAAAEEAAQGAMVTCVRCQGSFRAAQTVVTVMGPMCDRCGAL